MPSKGLFGLLVEPSVSEAEAMCQKALTNHRLLLIIGKCTVRYHGRAESTLGPGERLVIIKSDGSVLVHCAVGYEPVNWMPSGDTAFHAKATGDRLEVHAVRKSPQESVRILFDSLILLSTLNLEDTGEFLLYASEQDMQKALLVKPDLLEKGFRPISFEKKVQPGFVDVYGIDAQGRLTVVEIKRKTANKDAVLQLSRYIDAIKSKADRQVRGILVAPVAGKDVRRLLVTLGLEFRALDPKKCAATLRRSSAKRLEEFLGET